ncbi:MAG: hypothetical protein WBA57_02490 [Elainellaceae cyanobacterium]
MGHLATLLTHSQMNCGLITESSVGAKKWRSPPAQTQSPFTQTHGLLINMIHP